MSQHPSLRSSDKDKQHRSVIKRYERIKVLRDKELWKEGDSVYGLAKVKIVRFKIKKEKKEAQGPEGAEAGAMPQAPSGAAGQEKQPLAKEAPKSDASTPKKEAKK